MSSRNNGAKNSTGATEVPDILVGKDILELLSSSMYVDPLSCFREYVQNATDSIDVAVSTGVLPSIEKGKIEINLDHIDRRVVIRDNGVGLSNAEFSRRMLAFGASEKRGSVARGFRGVGRLSSLGYVQKLVFRSRSKQDKDVFEAVWDGRVIKKLMASNDEDNDLQAIVSQAVTIQCIDDSENYPPNFFEVELIKPRRISKDKMLNEVEIETYIAQICPCPFSPLFPFGEEISQFLSPYRLEGKSYNIYINEAETPIYRPYLSEIEYSDTKTSAFRPPRYEEITGINGDLAAICWFIHNDYQGAIPASQGIRGLRARIGNFQIGDDRIFREIFPEDRFCSWAVGEVHILDDKIVPNGRRDNFENNAHLENLFAHLVPIGKEVARECRMSSQKRNRLKSFETGAKKINEMLEVLKQGAISARYAKSIKSEIGAVLSDMVKAIDFDLFEDEDRGTLKGRLESIEEEVNSHSTKAPGDIFENIPQSKRNAYKEIFALIYDCSANQVVAKNLIDRMIARLNRP